MAWRKPLPLFDYDGAGFVKDLKLSYSCRNWLLELAQTPVPALLIDKHVLRQLEIGQCDQVQLKVSVKIGVDVAFQWKSDSWDHKFELVYYSNDTQKDYLDFHSDNRKIIPKNFNVTRIGNLLIPTVIPVFLEFWHRANFIPCRNMTMLRDSPKLKNFPFLQKFILKDPRIPAKESVESLALLRDQMTRFGIFPFLNGGTFLGWFRECTVIPHTTDMDIAIFSENWTPEFFDFLWSRQSAFRVKRQLGMVNDSYEVTVVPKAGFATPIDVFLLYEGRNETTGSGYRWVGGTAVDGRKYKYIYPPYDPYCAADLLGHIFWVTCTPEEKVTVSCPYSIPIITLSARIR
uniref:Fukutin n=1 Tax=Caenorhabditis tropicalis TaxID=1561998 RepID=A0A1I7T7B8_9PELO